MLPFVCQPMLAHIVSVLLANVCVWLWQAWYNAKHPFIYLPVTVFELITGGALKKIGKFDDQADASAAAGISGKPQKNGRTKYNAVATQLMH